MTPEELFNEPLQELPPQKEEEGPEYTAGEAFVGGFVRQNDALALGRVMEQQTDWDFDNTYEFENDEANKGYPAETIGDARSAEHAAYLRSYVDEDREALKKAQDSAFGFMGEVAGALLSPTQVPIIGAVKAGRIGYKGLAAMETAAVVGQEAVLQAAQTNRAIEESMMNAGVTFGTSMVLGKAMSLFNRVPPTTDPDVPSTPEMTSTAGAAEVATEFSPEELRMAGGRVSELLSMGPQAALLKDRISQTAPEAALKITESPFVTVGGEAGKTTGTPVTSAVYVWQGRLEATIDAIAPNQKASGLKGDDFWEAVGDAMARGDLHENVEVQKAAGKLRKNQQELEAELKEAGLLTKTKDDVAKEISEVAGRDVTAELADHDAAVAAHKAAQPEEPAVPAIDGVAPEAIEAWKDAPTTSKTGFTKKKAKENILNKASDRAAAERALWNYDYALAQYAEDIANAPPAPRLKIESEIDVAGVPTKTNIGEALIRKYENAPVKLGKYEESYLKRSYVRQKVYQNWERLVSILTRKFVDIGIDEAEAGALVEDTINNMLGGMPTAQATGGGASKSLKARTLDLTADELEPFRERRADILFREQVRTISPYLEMQKRFGDFELTETIQKINDEYNIARAKEPTAEGKQLIDNKRSATIKNLKLIRDRELNRINGSDASGTGPAIARGVLATNAAAQLGGIVASSAPDIGRPLMAYGFSAWAPALGKTIGHYFKSAEFRAARRQQLKKVSAGLERSLNQRAMDLLSSDLHLGETYTNKLYQWWSKYSGFNHWTDFVESLTAQAGIDWTMRQAAKAANGKPLSRATLGRLTRMGMDEDFLRVIHQQANDASVPQGDLWMSQSALWQNQAVARRFDEAIGSDVRRSIVRIGNGDKPESLDNVWAQLIFQYWNFMLASTNRMLVAGIQQRDAAILQGGLAMLGIGALSRGFKGELRGDNPSEWEPEKFLIEAIDGSGLGAIYGVPLRIIAHQSGLGSTRYAAREVEGIIGGPTASTLGNAYRATLGSVSIENGDFEWDAGQTYKYGARALPFVNNTWHLRQAIERAVGLDP